MHTRQAFGVLLSAAAAEIEKVQREGAACSARGDIEQALIAQARLARLYSLRAAAQTLQEQWHQVLPIGFPLPPATPRGCKTPEKAYWLPVLFTLNEAGGEERASKVLDAVGGILGPVLSDVDCEMLPSRHSLRWRNRAEWARRHMVDQGYLRGDSPRGVWAISEKGRDYLLNQLPLFPAG